VVLGLLIFPAFTRTYWAPMARGELAVHPAVHVLFCSSLRW
jgi:hypothetical protein